MYVLMAAKRDSDNLGDAIMSMVYEEDMFDVQSSGAGLDPEDVEEMIKHIAATADIEDQYRTILDVERIDFGPSLRDYFDAGNTNIFRAVLTEPDVPFEYFEKIHETMANEDDYLPIVMIRFRWSNFLYTALLDREADIRAIYFVTDESKFESELPQLVTFFE